MVSINGQAIATMREFRAAIVAARIGDTVVVQVERPNGPFRAIVIVTGYTYPRVRLEVRLEARPDATPAQRRRRERWINASP